MKHIPSNGGASGLQLVKYHTPPTAGPKYTVEEIIEQVQKYVRLV